MEIFESELEMLSLIEQHNEIIGQCISEQITFHEFLDKYGTFYDFYALDGHESDLDELKLFEEHNDKIAPHREVLEILSGLCSDEDAVKEIYQKADRFGSKEGLRRLKELFKNIQFDE